MIFVRPLLMVINLNQLKVLSGAVIAVLLTLLLWLLFKAVYLTNMRSNFNDTRAEKNKENLKFI